MCRILYETNPKNSLVMNSPLSPPSPISTTYNSYNHEMGSASSTFNKISPVLLLVIITLALIFFISGLLHLLVRFVMKRPAFSIVYGSNRFPETSGSHLPLQRQLQQLFRLHDSGLDQASIEALPVFYYKDIMGLKEPFDCAVCLCEFSELDKLRLLPSCSHAFHIQCIDTWLLSSSTCPLCRGTLSSSNPITENPWSNSHLSRQVSMTNQIPTDEENASLSSNALKPVVVEESGGEKRVFSVRLGKFRSLNNAENNGERGQGEARGSGSGSGSGANLDGRRCYSMGTYQYVEVDSDLQVALSNHTVGGDNGCSASVDEGDGEGKRIKGRSRGDSFSVSKIWLWSKNTKFPTLSSAFLDVSSSSSSSLDKEFKPITSESRERGVLSV